MSAVIVGSPGSGKKVLRRNEFSTQRNGLEFINEIYTIRTADRATLQPAFDTLHKNYSESATKYARMAVENVGFKEMDGDLTEMTVSYVGLTSASGLPRALVSIIPQMDKGIYGPPCVISVEYISDKSVAALSRRLPGGGGSSFSGFKPRVSIPTEINGTALPRNPRDPFNTGNNPTQVSAFFGPTAYTVNNYFGLVMESLQVQERGIFSVVVEEYAEAEEIIFVG
jgi:hypothetical protein